MLLSSEDIKMLVRALGKKGAKAGLSFSEYTNAELYEVAVSQNARVSKKTKRDDLINAIILSESDLIKSNHNYLLEMTYSNLLIFFKEKKATNSEIEKILESLELEAPSKRRTNLIDFAAREISDLGMYKRVSRGR